MTGYLRLRWSKQPLFLLIVIGVIFTACAVPLSAQTIATVSIGDVCAVPDSGVTVPIMVNNVTNLGSGAIDVYYNPEIIHVTDVESGAGNALVVQSWNVDNTSGLVQIAAWNTSEQHSGDVIFATVTCRAVASAGSTPLTIVVINLKAYSDYPYPEIPYTVSNGTFTITPIVVINEFVSRPTPPSNEWIELYNPTGRDLALDGWTVEDNTGSTYPGQTQGNTGSSLAGYTVPAYGYFVLIKKTHFTFLLNDNGDIIVLKNGTTVVDNVAYGTGAASTADGGVAEDNAPAPGHDESAGRFPNGMDTDNDRVDFRVFDTPTPNAPNTIAPTITSFAPPSPVSNNAGESRTFTIAVDQVVNVSWQINGTEVGSTTDVTAASYTNVSAAIGTWNVSAIASNPNGTDVQGWIWNVTPVTGAQQPVMPFMIHGRIFKNGTAWNNPAVKILNTNNSKQWYAETSAACNYYQLVLANGADLNVSEVLRFNVSTPGGSQSKTIEHTVTPDAIYNGGLFNVTISLGAPVQPDVVINEFVSTSKDNQTTEWIELYNPTGRDLALDGWTVEDNTGSTYPGQTQGNTGSSLAGYTVPAYRYFILTKGTHFNFALNDNGDIIVLKNGTTVVDNVAYGTGAASTADGGVAEDNAPAPGYNESAGRCPNGMDTDNDREDFSVFDVPTPGAPNTIAPTITSFAPLSPVSNNAGESRTFTIAVDQVVNVSWQINGTEVGSTTGVTAASYTNVSATIGTWNVSAIASNPNGTDIRTWWWTVKTSAAESRSLSAGWNLISTPTVLANNSWGNVTGLGDGLDYCIAYKYDPALGKWVQMKPNTQFKPLEAIFVKLNSPDVMEFVETTDPLTVPPARELSKGWNLIGLNDMKEVKVDVALRSIEVDGNGERGYISVYSPAYNSAEWTYTIGESPVPYMKPYEGYWVFMEHSDTLAGRII